ncbi:hypothetical protein Z961_04315 [Clostridium haemolyticum NCTC 8350]|uniref:Uncharacterized protein n=2 Tax=Clostridium haemolyticum TaxID=84025 RepID=A0ABR4TGX9_CLOHA|nr:hypothetical protein Z960_03825 [Clostridium haemolyticum NCTC 9693]KGN04180.1 hypothetical protein Z961_04315 [Clostridium haemolyticum NCTC 8350]
MFMNKKIKRKFKKDIRLKHNNGFIGKLDNIFKITTIKITKITTLLKKREEPINLARVEYEIGFNKLNPIAWVVMLGLLFIGTCAAVFSLFLEIISHDEYYEQLYFNKEDLEINSQK